MLKTPRIFLVTVCVLFCQAIFAHSQTAPTLDSCLADVQQMQDEIDRWNSPIYTKNGIPLVGMLNPTVKGSLCVGTGVIYNTDRTCYASWTAGRWGDTLNCMG